MRELTHQQIKDLHWVGNEKYALVSKRTKDIHYASENKESLEETLRQMREGGHALADILQLVEKP